MTSQRLPPKVKVLAVSTAPAPAAAAAAEPAPVYQPPPPIRPSELDFLTLFEMAMHASEEYRQEKKHVGIKLQEIVAAHQEALARLIVEGSRPKRRAASNREIHAALNLNPDLSDA
jgi:hypothetical protein